MNRYHLTRIYATCCLTPLAAAIWSLSHYDAPSALGYTLIFIGLGGLGHLYFDFSK